MPAATPPRQSAPARTRPRPGPHRAREPARRRLRHRGGDLGLPGRGRLQRGRRAPEQLVRVGERRSGRPLGSGLRLLAPPRRGARPRRRHRLQRVPALRRVGAARAAARRVRRPPHWSATPRSSRSARRGAWSPSSPCTTSPIRGGSARSSGSGRAHPTSSPATSHRVRANAGAVLPALGDDQRAQHRDAHGLDRGGLPARTAHGRLGRLLRARQPPHRARAGGRCGHGRPARRRGDRATRARRRSTSTTACCSTCSSCATPAWTRTTWTATWTSAGRCTTPPSLPSTPGRRRCAGSSPRCRPTAPSASRAGARPGPACAAATRRHAPRRVVAPVHASPRPAQPRRRRLRLVRPGGQPCPAPPGAADCRGAAGLVLRPRLLGRRVRTPRGCAPGASPSPRCARGSRCGWWRTAWRRGCRRAAGAARRTAWTGRATCASTSARWPTPWPPACRCAPTCTGR